MTFPRSHRRHSIRLKGYVYSQPGAYFLTLVARDRVCLFGEVAGGEIRLSAFGGIVREEWFKTAEIRPYVDLPRDEFVVMPNHIHGIMWILDDGVGARRRRAPTAERFGAPVSGSIPTVVHAFKSASTRRTNEERGKTGVPLWQRGYYEHVIRGDEQLTRLRQYIVDNPLQWELDRENPNASRLASAPSIDEPWRT